MRSNRMMMFAGVLGAAALAGALAVEADMEPAAEPQPGSAKNRPSGSKPVAGGGARERARRLARMAQETECETRPLENTDGIGRSMGEAAMTESHSVAVSPTPIAESEGPSKTKLVASSDAAGGPIF